MTKPIILEIDARRKIIIPGDQQATIEFCVENFIGSANQAISEHGAFCVALSGGSTPKAIFQALAHPENKKRVDWKRVYLFWSDERCVPLDHVDSNYKMAMESGMQTLGIPQQQIFPMLTDGDVNERARQYEEKIACFAGDTGLDMIMLGMGEDGHTASLFPNTEALNVFDRLVVANFLPQKNVWRMTLTYKCFSQAKNCVVYVLGQSKAKTVSRIFTDPYQPMELPIQAVGTIDHLATWILDDKAASALN